MANATWMVRAGEGAWRFEEFERQGLVSVGWEAMGDLSQLKTREDFVALAQKTYPNAKKLSNAVSAGQLYRFTREMKVGDGVITYKPAERTYLVGVVDGSYSCCERLARASTHGIKQL